MKASDRIGIVLLFASVIDYIWSISAHTDWWALEFLAGTFCLWVMPIALHLLKIFQPKTRMKAAKAAYYANAPTANEARRESHETDSDAEL